MKTASECVRLTVLTFLLTMLGAATAVRAEPPTAAQVLSDLGFSASDQQRVMQGEFVNSEVAPASDKDLSVAIAFLVKASPADLSQRVLAGSII